MSLLNAEAVAARLGLPRSTAYRAMKRMPHIFVGPSGKRGHGCPVRFRAIEATPGRAGGARTAARRSKSPALTGSAPMGSTATSSAPTAL